MTSCGAKPVQQALLSSGSSRVEFGRQRVGLLAGLPSLVSDLGANRWQMSALADVSLRDLADPETIIPFSAMGRLFDAGLALTGVQHFGLLLGQRTNTLHALGLVGELMQAAPTLGIALGDLAEHQRRYVQGSVISLVRSGSDAFLSYGVQRANVPAVMQISDAAVMAGINLTRKLAGVMPVEVQLAHAPPENQQPYHRILGVPVRFDAAQSGLILRMSDLDRPVLSARKERRAELERAVQEYWAVARTGIVTEASRALLPRISWNDDSLEAVARELDLHPRSLERHLRRAGTSFRTLRNLVRLEVTMQLLRETRMSVADIGEALGYGDTSAFVHWFKAAAGNTPGRWREATAMA